jgi:hypothetical protein
MTYKLAQDHTGRRIGQVRIIRKVKFAPVVVIRPGETYRPPLHWEALCDCGTIWRVPHTQITDTTPASCKACAPKARERRLNLPRGKHHKKSHPSYGSWYAMWRRCTSPKHVNYPNYGGRGITVCDRWKSFDAFVEDMGDRPQGRTIDRINNDLPYSPNNCRWATAKQQRANQRTPIKKTKHSNRILAQPTTTKNKLTNL